MSARLGAPLVPLQLLGNHKKELLLDVASFFPKCLNKPRLTHCFTCAASIYRLSHFSNDFRTRSATRMLRRLFTVTTRYVTIDGVRHYPFESRRHQRGQTQFLPPGALGEYDVEHNAPSDCHLRTPANKQTYSTAHLTITTSASSERFPSRSRASSLP